MTDDQHGPGPDDRAFLDPGRAAAIRGVLVETAEGEQARASRVRRHRVVAASIVTAVAAVATVGGLALGLGAAPPGDGGLAGPDLRPGGSPGVSSTPSPGTLEPVGTPTATAVPAPAPTPTRPAYDPSDPSTWTIASDSIGPTYLGRVESEQVAAMTAFSPTPDDGYGCPATFFERSDGLSLVTGSNGLVDETTYVVLSGDPARGAAALAAASPTTESGIGLGSDRASVLAAYPDARLTLDAVESYGVQYAVDDGLGNYVVFVFREGGFVTSVAIGSTEIAPPEFCG
jgi:hypothetical protein